MTIPLSPRRKSRWPRLVAGIGIIAIGAMLALQLRAGPVPQVDIRPDRPALGLASSVLVRVTEPLRGPASIRVRVVQGQTDHVVLDESFATASAFELWAPPAQPVERSVPAGRDAVPGLTEGQASVVVEARGAATLLRSGVVATASVALPVLLKPPVLARGPGEVSVAQGGAGLVVYTVGRTASRHGVESGGHFFAGVRRSDLGPDAAVALFAVAYDEPRVDEIALLAEDVVDNRVRIPIVDRYERRPLTRDTINVTTAVMEAVVPKIMARTPSLEDQGSLVENYIQINRDLRAALARQLIEIGQKSSADFSWRRAFIQMPAKVVSPFADRRTYFHEGERIDEQDHLGFDLASVKKDRVPAANDGTIVFCDYFGIYGNTIIIDHGLGLMTLYAHLSSFGVKEGEAVTRGQIIGRTGATGLALGDHLHFTTMVRGVPTNPLEWWDEAWIASRIVEQIPSILDFKRTD